MSLEEEQHEDTDSLLDELEAAERLNETSLSSDADDTNAASIMRRLWRVRPVAGSNMRPRPIPWR